eukprot:g9546.t1
MESSSMETEIEVEIGALAFFPPDVLHSALGFLDGRALAILETASRGTRQAVQDRPGLYKSLLLKKIDNIPHMVSLPNKEGKLALMSWDAGDFQPILARVSSRRTPPPRYLHRMAEAGDGWTYLHGGHLESGLSGDVWRFRVSESKPSDGDGSTVRAVKVRWEQVWGGEGGQEGAAEEDAGSDGTEGSESDEEREPENVAVDIGGANANPNAAAADAASAPDAAPNDPNHHPAPPAQAPQPPEAAAVAALGAIPAPPPNHPIAAGAHQPALQPAFQAAMLAVNHGVLGAGFEDAAGVDANGPRPRCAASWTPIPGTNRIILFGGQGSENQFLGDLWCFHAGGRGECRWERLKHEREPRPNSGGGGRAEDQAGGNGGDNEGGGARGPWRVPEGRWGHTMVEHRGLLYMFGGSSPGKAYAGLWRLDPSVSPCVWSLMRPAARDTTEAEAAEAGRPGARGGHSATVVKDSLYIFGGNILRSVFKDLWAVDLPACTAWRQVPTTPEFPPARIGHVAVTVGNRILVYGGRNFKTGIFTGGLHCFDVDRQAFVRFPAEAFSRESVHPGGMWNGLRMTGHAAVPCSRGLLIVGGLLPRGQSFTMSAWTLDVIGGTRTARQQRRRHRGCCNSSVGTPAPPLAEARAAVGPSNHRGTDSSRDCRSTRRSGAITARHSNHDEGKKKSPPKPLFSCPPRRKRTRLTLPVAVAALALALAKPLGALAQEAEDDADGGSSSPLELVFQLVVVAVLVAASGLFSGLTLGLLGLDKIGLEIISHGDEPQMASFAEKIQPVRADGNLLLCTLLLGNVAVNALLSIVMAELTSGLVGFALATVIITIFGEIIPQAVCSRHALRIGAKVVPLVKLIILVFYPITKPLSIILDKLLGDEIGTIHSRKELSELLKIHVEHGAIDVETGREVAGAMNYKEHTVRDVMTPVKDCFMLSVSEKLNFKTLSVIFKSGFSRIPVFGKDHNDVIGLLFTKDLIFIDPDDETPLQNFVQIFGRAVTVVWPDYTLGDVLNVFKQGKSHLGLVRDVNNSGEGDPFYEVVGIITLEDIIEDILGDDIVDETDAFVDVENQLPVQRSEFDMSRLQLLNANADKSVLSTDEAKAVASHLMANVPQFEGVSVDHVESIIAASPVVEVNREDKHMGRAEPAPAEVLYRRGRTSTMCTLILTGKVVVLAGRDGFRSDAGPWTVLGADALVEDEGAYKPDFSAHAGSERLRCVRISKASFDTITSTSRKEGETCPALRIEAGNGENSTIFDGGSSNNNMPSASGNGGGDIGSARKHSAANQRTFSDEGGTRNSITSTASSGGGGAGTLGTIKAPSPPRKRGLPSGASLKILQAATGVAMIPAAATSPAAAQGTQTADDPPPPPETTTPESSTRLVAEDEEAGISLGTTATATSTSTTTTAGMVPRPSSRVAGSEEDVESGTCSEPPSNQQGGGDGVARVNPETHKTARI